MIGRMVGNLTLNPPTSLRDIAALVRPGSRIEVAGKTILLTGASSGVGEAAAQLLAGEGAELILVARGAEGLEEVRSRIVDAGGRAHVFTCDLADGESVDELVAHVDDQFSVDVLINNAGRSIRRTAVDSVNRFHDYERTMALNYFGPARLALGLLPSMIAAGDGHIVNVATWGVHAGVMPKFSAYHASKSAISSFGRDLGAEVHGTGVHVTTVDFPLIRTPMIAPTADYDSQPALSPEQAASWLLRAIRTRPVELYPRYSGLLRAIDFVAPGVTDNLVRRSGI